MDGSSHDYDISIGTLDNTDWHIRIQLENKLFEEKSIQREGRNGWLYCKAGNKVFKADGAKKFGEGTFDF